MKIIVVMHNIRSCQNVGAILRTCEGFGVSQVIFSGYTPRIDDNRVLPHLREKLNKQIHKTALGAEEMVYWRVSEDIFENFREMEEQGWRLVGLENNIDDARLISLRDSEKVAELGEKVVLVLGEEVKGIPLDVREKMDAFLEIPMVGRKESFNVSVATGVALFALTGVGK